MSSLKDQVHAADAASNGANGAENNVCPPAYSRDGSARELSHLSVAAYQECVIFLLDRQGRIKGWNSGAARIKGYQAGQILGQHLSILYPPEDQSIGKPERNLQQAAEEGYCEDEGWRVRKSGERFWAKVMITCLRDRAGRLRGFSKVVCDLTEQRRMAEELRGSEERFRSLFHNVHAGVMLFGPRGELLMSNQTALDLLGFSKDPVGVSPADPDWETFCPDGSPCAPENRPIQQAIASKMPVRDQLLGVKIPNRRELLWLLAGAEPQLAADGSVTQVLYTFADMTQSKLVGDSCENRYEAAIQASGQILYDWNLSAGEVSFSGSVKETLGYHPEEIGTKLNDWIDLIHPVDRTLFEEAIERVTATGEAFRAQFRMQRKDGAYITVRSDGFFFLDTVQRSPRMIGFISDISERVQLEDRLRRALRVEGAGQFTGSVAHDFNNILAAIQGYSAVLCDGVAATGPLRQAADGIAKAAGLATALTGQLLVRNRPAELEVVDLNRVVRGMESMLRRLLGERIELHFLLRAGGLVLAAPDRAEQLILNLVVKARDAMPTGGTLTIETANRLTEDDRGPYVMLAVTDTGSGVDAEISDPAFDRFFTAKDDGSGRLGLSTVFGIVRQSGGFIKVRTAERGSVFETYWRRADEISPDDAPKAPLRAVRARRRKANAAGAGVK